MIKIKEITDLAQIYNYQMHFSSPYFFPADFETWKSSFTEDIDGEGRVLFRELCVKAACDDGKLVGFIQYGTTAFGFDESGDISTNVSYPVIRSLYFDKGHEEVGRMLLNEAMEKFETVDRVYAFFHYFGMSCFARHGKLFETLDWIEAALTQYGFVIEHENVYYTSTLKNEERSEVKLIAHNPTTGNQQTFDFVLNQKHIGSCEVHYLESNAAAYLRWIYINDDLQNQGIGSKCMASLKQCLRQNGIFRLDTDTALCNTRAQHYYEKNGFLREGITRSYYLDK